MDVRDIKYFFAIANECSITKAAKHLHIAQPPLSRQMKLLENDLGVQLFERGSRRINLTDAGKLLRVRAEQILTLFDTTEKELSGLGSGITGTLLIGTIATLGAAYLPDWIKIFRTKYPGITYQLWEGDSFRVFDLLDSGVIEIGLVRAPYSSDVYEFLPLPEESLSVAMNTSGCICGDNPDCVRLVDLLDQPLIVQRRYEVMFRNHCKIAGFTPTIVSVSDGMELDLLWVRAGIAMALVSTSANALLPDSGLIFKTLVEPSLHTQASVVWLKGRKLSSTASHFLECIKSDCAYSSV